MSKIKAMHNEFAIIKPTTDIQLHKMTPEERKAAKEAVINLKEFIKGEYPSLPPEETKTKKQPTYFKCTIRDIGLSPFEIDIYDNRMLVVEVTGKMVKDELGNPIPHRRYVSRNNSISTCLDDICTIMARRKIAGMESTVITMRDYHNAFSSFQRYIAKIVSTDYVKAMDAMQSKFPFTKISLADNDEEDWFKGKEK